MSHRGRITKRTDGRSGWRFEIDTTDPATGKRRRIVRGGFKTKGEAQDALAEALRERGQGREPGRSPRLGPWLTSEWLPAATPTLGPTTAPLYATTVRAYIVPELGGLKLSEVTPGAITALYGRLGERLAPKTVRNVHGVLHRALRDAVRWGLLSVNPADSADPPQVPRTEPETWTAEQVVALFSSFDEDRLGAMWRLFATTGLRRAEVCGLRWVDLDLDRGWLSVVRTRTEYAGKVFEKDAKSAAGRRRVALDPGTLTALREHRRRQLEERMAWGEGWIDSGLVFTREDGSPIRPSWVTRQLPMLSEAAGVPRATPHTLRHTWATLALKAGVHPKVVAGRLGHSSVQLTLDRYSHVVPGLDQAAADEVAALFDTPAGDIGVTFSTDATRGDAGAG